MKIKNTEGKTIICRDSCFDIDTLFDICREENISLEKADLRGVDLSDTDMHLLNCRNADFTSANFSNAYLGYADFSGADCTNAIFEGANVDETNFNAAIFEEVNVNEFLNLDEAKTQGIIFELQEEVEETASLAESKYKNNFNLIVEGKTGSGKTYQTINYCKDNNLKFMYVAPCRQLVYESYMKYASKIDALTTGEVKIAGNGNVFGVFESAQIQNLINFDAVIIDEAHFISDTERGGHLQNIVNTCKKNKIKIFLVTATRNFKLDEFKIISLKSNLKTPKKVEVSWATFKENIENGMQTIVFVPRIKDTYSRAERYQKQGHKAVAFNSAMSPSERLKLQIAFAKKEVQIIVCTNVLAQGVNFECENILIEEDFFNTPELIEQKIGRLGRPFMSSRNEVYYCIEEYRKNIRKKKINTSTKKEVNREFQKTALDYAVDKIENLVSIEYNDVKYCIQELKYYFQKKETVGYSNKKEKKIFRKTITKIAKEQLAIKNIILDNVAFN